MSANEKSEYKDNGWFVGVTPRRNPEIVVACLFEGGEHGALAARVAAKVITAYVEKQRTRQTTGRQGQRRSREQARPRLPRFGMTGDAQNSRRKLQAGHFTVCHDWHGEAGGGCAGRGRQPSRSSPRPASHRVAHRDGGARSGRRSAAASAAASRRRTACA